MGEIKYNSALMPSPFVLPFLFFSASALPDNHVINTGNTNNVSFEYKTDPNGYEIFQTLLNRNIDIETSHIDLLNRFISKITTESKDLDGEITDMVNRKFEKLLLKI